MTKLEMEKRLSEYLDERYAAISIPDTCEGMVNEQIFYDGICATIAQIGGWERREDGKHFVKLN